MTEFGEKASFQQTIHSLAADNIISLSASGLNEDGDKSLTEILHCEELGLENYLHLAAFACYTAEGILSGYLKENPTMIRQMITDEPGYKTTFRPFFQRTGSGKGSFLVYNIDQLKAGLNEPFFALLTNRILNNHIRFFKENSLSAPKINLYISSLQLSMAEKFDFEQDILPRKAFYERTRPKLTEEETNYILKLPNELRKLLNLPPLQ